VTNTALLLFIILRGKTIWTPLSVSIVIICVALLAAIFLYLLKISRRPVLEINLFPAEDPGWSDKEKATEWHAWFIRNGFEHAGTFQCWEMPSVLISGFVRPQDQMLAAVCDHPQAGMWIDIGTHYEDNGGLNVSNVAMSQSLDSMPGQVKFRIKGGTPDELLEKALAERRDKGRVAITKGEFASFFEERYREEMKWRMGRGGPTQSEVMRVAQGMETPADPEKILKATDKIREAWAEAKDKPAPGIAFPFAGDLPAAFLNPEAFRKRMEEKCAPIPRLNMPPLLVYPGLTAALCWWCYFGYQYNSIHRQVPFAAVITFLLVFAGLFIWLMSYRQYHKRVRTCPVLKRVSELRPGAFLFVRGNSPSIFYAREKWLGKVEFNEGSKSAGASTRLNVVSKYMSGSLTITNKNFLTKVMGFGGKDAVEISWGDFGDKFAVDVEDEAFIQSMVTPALREAVLPLERFDDPLVEINGNSIAVEAGKVLSQESGLAGFLENAESIIEVIVRQSE
jgi:hypothetical protein